MTSATYGSHDDVIKWKHFPRYWPFERGIHRLPANSPHKNQWRRALMFSLICAWINTWVHNCKAADLRCHHVHYGVTVMRIWTHKRHSFHCPPRQAMECLLKFTLFLKYFLVLHFMLLVQNICLLVALYDISGGVVKVWVMIAPSGKSVFGRDYCLVGQTSIQCYHSRQTWGHISHQGDCTVLEK